MTTEQTLQALITAGASFTPWARPSETVPLAAAHVLTSGDLWICALWPENEFAQHWRSFHHVEVTPGSLVFRDKMSLPLFAVASLDADERAATQWDRWQMNEDEETKTSRAFVRSLEVGVLHQLA